MTTIQESFLSLALDAQNNIKKGLQEIEVIVAYLQGQCDGKSSDQNEQYMKYKNITIRKRNDNRWVATPTQNKEKIYIYGKTQKECYEKLKLYYTNNNKETKKQIANNIKLYEWLELWKETYKKPMLKPTSLYQIENCIKNHIKKHIENIQLNKLTAIDIDIALNKIDSTRMRKYTFDCYVESLRQAYKNKLIKEDVSTLINHVQHTRTKGRALNQEERKIFLNCTKKVKYGQIFEFQLYSGCRPQGARELKWEDIKENQVFINETKSKNGTRHIPLFDNIKKLLDTIEKKDEYVFPISETTIKKQFIELKTLCGFEFTQKDLRHTFATICAENGINENTIAKWLGHGSPNTTRQYYIQVLSEFETQERDKINKIEF